MWAERSRYHMRRRRVYDDALWSLQVTETSLEDMDMRTPRIVDIRQRSLCRMTLAASAGPQMQHTVVGTAFPSGPCAGGERDDGTIVMAGCILRSQHVYLCTRSR